MLNIASVMKAKEQKSSPSQSTHNRRKYDATFKQEVLKMIDNGRSVSEVAQSLGIGENLIYRWRAKTNKKVELTATVEAKELLSELQLLREKLRQTELEREILKKALSIFSRTP